MKGDYERTANDFLELSSEQRLAILFRLYNGKSKVSVIAKELDATVPEVFRNFERLVKADLIAKDADGNYDLTAFGKTMCSQIPLLRFLSENRKYFKDHEFGDIPKKFLQRIGALENGEHVSGFVKVLERWKEIYEDANEYISNVLFEVPYTSDMIESLFKKVNGGKKLRSILSESAIIPKERKKIFEKLGFKKLVEEGKIERKMRKEVKTVIILNEKEACVMFPTVEGEPDMSQAFFGKDEDFHEWCLDYFNYCWERAGPFIESKLGIE
jgi:predicted transcriptional regulator